METKKRNLTFSNNPVHINSLPKYSWIERDTLLLHIAFQIFMDALEKDRVLEVINWECNDEYRTVRQYIIELRNWWLQRKDKDRLKEIDYSDEQQYEEDSTHLHMLMLIRKYLVV